MSHRNCTLRLVLNTILTMLLVSVTKIESSAQSDRSSGGNRDATQQPVPAQDKSAKSDGSIKGRVIGEGSRGVPDASIMAFPVNVSANMRAMVTSFLRPINTDADGKFEITGLQAGAYNISASAPGFVLSDSDSKFYRPGDNVTLTLVKGAVMTGRVTSSTGDPIVGIVVRAIKLREIDNRPLRDHKSISTEIVDSLSSMLGPYKTDDRGIYRIYGLTSGYYQVAAGGSGGRNILSLQSGPYANDAPTYFPSSTLYTAAEITLHTGEEAANIDIRYRENRGHSIAGTVSGAKLSGQQQGTSVVLTRASSGIVEATTFVITTAGDRTFAFEAVLDGEYVVTATAGSGAMMEGPEGLNLLVSPSRRVTISGEDVTGIDLALEPLGSISGRAVFEPLKEGSQKPDCKPARRSTIEEMVISAQREGKRHPEDQASELLSMFKDTTPNDKGEFTIAMLRSDIHHLALQPPGEQLFVKSILLPATNPNGKPRDLAKTGIALKSGEKVKDLVVTISEGAATLRGRVMIEGDKPPSSKMRVHLVPAEPEATDDVLRYFETEVAADAGFSLTNLVPGKYWLIARELSEEEQAEVDHKPLAWDAGERVGLRFEGEASNKVITLAQCQRVDNFVLNYAPLIKPTKPSKKKAGN
jgi:hypothetical protein